MAVDLTAVIAVLFFLVTLYFTVFPLKKFVQLNILFGLLSIIIGSVGLAGWQDLPFYPWFALAIGIVGVLCLWSGLVGDRLG